MERTKRRELQRLLLAAIFVGAIAVTIARLTGTGARVASAVFLGLQPFAMAWSDGVPMVTPQRSVAAVVGAACGVALSWIFS